MLLRFDPRRLWDDKNLQKATTAVEQGGASIRHAEEKYGIRSILPLQAITTCHTSCVYSLLTTIATGTHGHQWSPV